MKSKTSLIKPDISAQFLEDLEIFIEYLDKISTNIPIGRLSSRERFKTIIETLMGHPRIRGDLRTKDLILEPSWENVFGFLDRLHGQEIPENFFKMARTENFGRWLQIFALLECDGRFRNNDKFIEEENYSYACVLVVFVVTHTLVSMLDGRAKEDIAFMIAHIIAESLGITQQEFLKKDTIKNSRVCELAVHTSIFVNTKSPRFQKTEFESISIAKMPLRILTIKTLKVQTLINLCKSPYLTRGVSVCCSQILSAVRELTAEFFYELDKTIMLVCDTEVFVRWFLPGIHDELELRKNLLYHLKSKITQDNGREFFKRFFPRVMPWAEEAIKHEQDLSSVFPGLSLHISEEMTVSDLFEAHERSCEESKVEEEPRFYSILNESCCQNKGNAECELVEGDNGIFNTAPPWWSPKKSKSQKSDPNGSHEKKENEIFGWRALLWGQIGAGFRRQVNTALRRKFTRPLSQSWVHHGELTSHFKPEFVIDRFAWLKFDGDKIGAMFKKLSLVDRPSMSFRFRKQIEQMTRQAIEKCEEFLCSRIGDNKFKVAPFAVDITYMGGDDLLFCMPLEYVEHFLTGLEGISDEWPARNFSVSIVAMPDDLKVNEKARVNSSALKLLVQGMCQAKGKVCADRIGLPTENVLVGERKFECVWSEIKRNNSFLHGWKIDMR